MLLTWVSLFFISSGKSKLRDATLSFKWAKSVAPILTQVTQAWANNQFKAICAGVLSISLATVKR